MKKLYSTVTGIDQGTVQLFSDFEVEGEMWAGSGDRQRVQHVDFSESFKSPPSVMVTLEMLDLHHGSNHRVVLKAENVTPQGFDIIFRTWDDTRIARAAANWMAVGEARGSGDWDLDDQES